MAIKFLLLLFRMKLNASIILKNVWVIIGQYFLKKKSLNYVIWLLVVSILAELKAISNYESINALFSKLEHDTQSKLIEYDSLISDVLFNSGSQFVLLIQVLTLILIIYLRSREISSEKRIINNETRKKEILLKAINKIKLLKRLSEREFTLILNSINDDELKEKISLYYSFERKRGNIYQLEKIIHDNQIINHLEKHTR